MSFRSVVSNFKMRLFMSYEGNTTMYDVFMHVLCSNIFRWFLKIIIFEKKNKNGVSCCFSSLHAGPKIVFFFFALLFILFRLSFNAIEFIFLIFSVYLGSIFVEPTLQIRYSGEKTTNHTERVEMVEIIVQII